MKNPSKKQIELADKIAKKLNLDFPRGDYDFTSQSYWNFINQNIEKYKRFNKSKNFFKVTRPVWADDEDIFFGYEEGLWEY